MRWPCRDLSEATRSRGCPSMLPQWADIPRRHADGTHASAAGRWAQPSSSCPGPGVGCALGGSRPGRRHRRARAERDVEFGVLHSLDPVHRRCAGGGTSHRAAGTGAARPCVTVKVTATEPYAFAQQASEGNLSSVWVPDTPLWVESLTSASAAKPVAALNDRGRIGWSPVLMAVPPSIATATNTGLQNWLGLLATTPVVASPPTSPPRASCSSPRSGTSSRRSPRLRPPSVTPSSKSSARPWPPPSASSSRASRLVRRGPFPRASRRSGPGTPSTRRAPSR